MARIELKYAAHISEAARLLEEMDFEEALVQLDKADFLQPGSLAVLQQRCSIYLRLGDLRSAMAQLRTAVRRWPDEYELARRLAELYDAEGVQLLAEGLLSAAIAHFSQALELNNLNRDYWMHRATAFVRKGAWERALFDVDHYTLLCPTNAHAFVLRAKLNWKLGMLEKGNADFKIAHRLSPEHAEVRLFESMIWAQADGVFRAARDALLGCDFRKATDLLASALEMNPGDTKILVLKAGAHRKLQQFDEALACLDSAALVYLTEQRMLLRMQLQEEAAEREEAASRAAEEAASERAGSEADSGSEAAGSRPGSAFSAAASSGRIVADEELEVVEHPEITRQRNLTFNDMALLLKSEGRVTEALSLFNKVVESEEELLEMGEGARMNPVFLINRGDCYRDLARLQQALANYHRAYDLAPSDAGVKLRLSLIHNHFGTQRFNVGAFADAEVEFSLAVQYSPDVAAYYFNRGNACFAQRRLAAACKDWRATLRLQSSHAGARARLAEFETTTTRSTATAVMRGIMRAKPARESEADHLAPLRAEQARKHGGRRRVRRKRLVDAHLRGKDGVTALYDARADIKTSLRTLPPLDAKTTAKLPLIVRPR